MSARGRGPLTQPSHRWGEGWNQGELGAGGVGARAASQLLDRVRDVARRKYYSIRTEGAYVNWIRRYILFHDKRPP